MINKLLALRALIAVVNGGNFISAAKVLNMTPSAITKIIAQLEADLGARLLNRSMRLVTPTEAGQLLYESSTRVLAELDATAALISTQAFAPTGTLRVYVPHSFGRVTLIPELGRFLAENPKMRLDLHFGDDYVDLSSGGYDVAVFVGDIPDSKSMTRTLIRGKQVVVASPEYLAKHPAPMSPDDLRAHNCIAGKFGKTWALLSSDGTSTKVTVDGNLTIRNADALREAAVSGLGIVKSTWWLLRKDLATKRVVPVLPDFESEALTISLCYSSGPISARTRVFVDFLVEITGRA
jgi:DNA-binding transcriptional LysR family regulator